MFRNITKEVNKAIRALDKADERMYAKIEQRGLAGGDGLPDGRFHPEGPLPDCPLSVAQRELGGWEASTPVQIAAQWCLHGMLLRGGLH